MVVVGSYEVRLLCIYVHSMTLSGEKTQQFWSSFHGTFYYLLGVPTDSCLGGYLALEFQSDMCLEKSPFPLENPLSLHDVRAI